MSITIGKPGDQRGGSSVTDVRTSQRAGSTFLQHALSSANDTAGGRFAGVNRTIVVGATPTPQYPQLPGSSPWAHDYVPAEEPLGYSVDDLVSPAGLSLSPAATGPAPAAPSVNRPDESRDAGPSSSDKEDAHG
jgi:hypothetical protein